MASLAHTGRKRIVLGYVLVSHAQMKLMSKQMVLNKFRTSCWGEFIAILDHMWPACRGLDAPGLAGCVPPLQAFLWFAWMTAWSEVAGPLTFKTGCSGPAAGM